MLAVSLVALCASPAHATTLPTGFTETTVWSGLGHPTVVRFAADGRVYVATKAGVIYTFDSVDDPTPTLFADLSADVQDFWDRGLLGMAIAPDGRVFVAYSHDTGWGDTCPDGGTAPPGCRIDARLSRIDADGTEHVLLTDYCHQFPSHSVGTLAWGPDNHLYLSAGEGAHFDYADFGQIGNVCHDPPNAGGDIGPPESEGGALRAQAYRRPLGQPFTPDGSVIRIDPAHPAIDKANVVAYGFRNPFRFAFRPGANELWLGDVGWTTWEELNRVPLDGTVRNYGWPCYEGPGRQDAYDDLDVTTCESLYAEGSVTAPYLAYNHGDDVLGCAGGDSSISAVGFYTGSAFPSRYRDGVFVGDYARDCIWFQPFGGPLEPFATGAPGPVFLTEGPDDALYYADLNDGEIRRIGYHEPTARITATPESGQAPLTVAFDGRGSSDQEGQTLTYAWDLDGDGDYDDSTSATPTRRYDAAESVTVRLRVTNPAGKRGRAAKTIAVGAPPVVAITSPAPGTTWAVGDRIGFAGTTSSGTLTWSLALRHCSRIDANQCHTHQLENFAGTSGSFVAPDHEYPSHLELTATAIDTAGLTTKRTVRLDPRTTDVTLASSPPGLRLAFGSESLTAPFTRTVIAGSAISLNAPSPQGGLSFTSWSDGGTRVHTATAPDGGDITYTATFDLPPTTFVPGPIPAPIPGPPPPPPPAEPAPAPVPVAAWGFDEPSGTKVPGGRLQGPLRVRGGRFGNALDFDGKDDWVTVEAPKLEREMTVEAWVRPTRKGGSLGFHETKRGDAWALYQDESAIGARAARGKAPRLRRWTHLAMTYDGATIRRYVNGTLAGTSAHTGTIPPSRRPLRFGGNAVFKQWFKGRLDEVRVYASALTPAQIQADMTTPINTTVKAAKKSKRVKGGAKVKRYRGART
jgi:glucose/arabinose dehydrogenase